MKTKVLFCGLSLMVTTLGFTACDKENVQDIISEDNNNGDTNVGDETKLIPMTFTAVGESCSRTELQPDNSVYWSPGDSIAVFSTSKKKYLFVTDITKTSSNASFHGNIEVSDSYIAFYPYPSEGRILSFEYNSTNLRFQLPKIQRAVNGTFDKSLNPSLAFADSDNKLVFKNLCSLIKFQFTGDALEEVKKITITDRNNTSMNNLMRYDVSTGELTAVYIDEPSISIGADKFEDMGTYYFVVPPVKGALSNGFTISFYNEQGLEICSKSTSSPVNLAPGKIINMGILEAKKDGVDYEIVDGTYLVYKASGLKAWADHVSAGNWSTSVRLMNNITFDVNEYWTPVGNKSNSSKYCGVIDGNGKTISGLKIGQAGSTDDRNAFVMLLGENGVIKNLIVESPVCYGGTYASVLAGSCEKGSSIINCHVKDATLECASGGASGIICGGFYEGYIEGCTATGEVTGINVNDVGGLVGLFSSQSSNNTENPLIVCSSFQGVVKGIGNGINYGGLIGNMGGQIKGCYAVASVNGNDNVGGLFGNVTGYNSLTASYFKGDVTCGSSNSGLLIGYVNNKTFAPLNAYYCQDGGEVSAAVGNKTYTEFVKIENNVWDAAITDMNNNIGDTYKYKYVWDADKQHPVLQATE